jgi:hypothetical protein
MATSRWQITNKIAELEGERKHLEGLEGDPIEDEHNASIQYMENMTFFNRLKEIDEELVDLRMQLVSMQEL